METKTEIKQNNGFASLLQYPDFLKVWFGRTISRFGDALDSIAFMWLMYKLTGSTLLMGTVMAVSAVPSMFGMAFGVLVDRMNKKKIMIWMDLLRGISTGAIAFLYFVGDLQIWELYVFAFFNSLCEVFSSPARVSAMQVMVRKEHYLVSNSLSQASGAAAEIVGTGAAAAIIGFWGVGAAILIDAATFVISALTAMAASIENTIENNGTLNLSKFFSELLDGLKIIKTNSLIFINIVLGCLVNILLAPFNVFMPVYSDKVLNAAEQGYSYMGIGILVGMILGSILVGQVGNKFKRSTRIFGGFILMGICIGALGFVSNLELAIVFCMATGASLPIITATGQSVIQEFTPREKMGRVSSTMGTIALLGMPLGYAVSGIAGEGINVQFAFMVIGVIMVLISIPPLFNKEFRKV